MSKELNKPNCRTAFALYARGQKLNNLAKLGQLINKMISAPSIKVCRRIPVFVSYYEHPRTETKVWESKPKFAGCCLEYVN